MTDEFIIAGWMDYGADDRDEVLKHFAAVARPSREEEGCLGYTVAADVDHPGRVLIYEHWTDEAKLSAHFRTEHIATFRAAMAPFTRVDKDLHRFFVAGSEEFSSAKVPS